MNKFSEKKSIAIAILLVFVAIATLQSVAAPNQPQQVSSSTTTGTAPRYHTHNGGQFPALIDYGVVRLQTTATGIGTTINIAINSTDGPIYLEQLQISLDTAQTNAIVASSLTIGGLNGPTCNGNVIAPSQLYGDFLPTCPSSAKVIDPVGNLAIAASAGTSTSMSIQPVAVEASQVNGQVVIMALVCAPVTANITLTANLL